MDHQYWIYLLFINEGMIPDNFNVNLPTTLSTLFEGYEGKISYRLFADKNPQFLYISKDTLQI